MRIEPRDRSDALVPAAASGCRLPPSPSTAPPSSDPAPSLRPGASQPDGTTGGTASGLGPNIQNWGIGLSVTFSASEIASIRARKEIEFYNERAEAARYDQAIQDITAQVEKAHAMLAGARRIAQNTPIQLQAARDTEQQASARYKTGLGNIVEVAEAQRILNQAEIEDALAKLGVWRGLLGPSIAAGDVQTFVQQTIQ
jgi:outer membrane protein TolC